MKIAIFMNRHEIQSRYSRVRHAEGLILQLPNDHDGRNTWLLNYGTGLVAMALRAALRATLRADVNKTKPAIWDEKTESLSTVVGCPG